MKKKRISFKDFTQIFSARTFTWSDKIGKSIYIVEREGNYSIEEHTSLIGKVLITFMLPLALAIITLLRGFVGLIENLGDLKYLYSNKPLREDELRKNTSQTDALLQLAGWV